MVKTALADATSLLCPLDKIKLLKISGYESKGKRNP